MATCETCDKPLSKGQKYCNKHCKKVAKKRRRAEKYDFSAELLVAREVKVLVPQASKEALEILKIQDQNGFDEELLGLGDNLSVPEIVESIHSPQVSKKNKRFSFKSSAEVERTMVAAASFRSTSEHTQKHKRTAFSCFSKFLEAANIPCPKKGSKVDKNLLLFWVQTSLEAKPSVEGSKRPMYKVDSFRDTYIPHLILYLKDSAI